MQSHPKKARKRLGFTDSIRAEVMRAKKDGWSRYGLAKELGVSGGAFHLFAVGSCGIGSELLDRLADVLGLVVVVDPRRRRAPPKNRRSP